MSKKSVKCVPAEQKIHARDYQRAGYCLITVCPTKIEKIDLETAILSSKNKN